MKKCIFFFLFSFYIMPIFAQDDDKSASLLELLEYKLLFELLETPAIPPYITQVTKYPLSGLGASGIRTKIEIHKYVYDGENKYFMQFLQNSFGAYEACYIGYDGIAKIQEAIEILKKDLEDIGGSEKDFHSNYISRGGNFKVGYYFVKNNPQWYIVVGSSGIRTSIEGTFWLEEALKEAKTKIESLM